MAKFLRMTRQGRWLKYPDLEWMSQHDIQSDALNDLQTKDNTLSVYRVVSGEDTERVVVALAANRRNLANMDYAVFEDVALASIPVNITQQMGETPDEKVNRLHYDITDLTVESIAQLAKVVSSGRHDRIPKKKIETELRRSIRAGILDRDKLEPQLLEKIQ